MNRIISPHQRLLREQKNGIEDMLRSSARLIYGKSYEVELEFREAAKCLKNLATSLQNIDASMEFYQRDIERILANPTSNLNDVVYKRVAIQDACYSLQLNMSLWRLSWVTFIFLPLTFIATLFGMNVDLLSDNPSFKW
ncbi:hypothetical protein F4819DRAFT_491654 [Hypoxylon fuscum]|nr:hypothetical protein F4819DRAFT_491654 [Hypoxylon fuscum]